MTTPSKIVHGNCAFQGQVAVLKKAAFIDAYSSVGIIAPACITADIPRSTYHTWLKNDPEFKEAVADALETAVDIAELELRARAVEGIEVPVMFRGEPIWKRCPTSGDVLLDDNFDPIPYTQVIRSDKLLEVYMKANRNKYREKGSLEVTGANGGPIDNRVQLEYIMPTGKSPEDYEEGVTASLSAPEE